MREQVRAFQESVWFNHNEVRVTEAPGALMALTLLHPFLPPAHLAASCLGHVTALSTF